MFRIIQLLNHVHPVAATADDCLFEFISFLICTVCKTTNCLEQSELQGSGAWPPPASLIQSLKQIAQMPRRQHFMKSLTATRAEIMHSQGL